MKTRDIVIGGIFLYSTVVSPACDVAAKKYVWGLTKEEAAVVTALQGMPYPSNLGYACMHRAFYGEGIYDTLKPINEQTNKRALELIEKSADAIKPFILVND